jgi:hypothetical protein
MSRSYRKHPINTDGRDGRVTQKRWANKKVRRYKNKIANGKAYKHIFESWEIHDYISRWSWEQAKEEYEHSAYINSKGEFNYIYQDDYPTLKDFYNKCWSKVYRRK